MKPPSVRRTQRERTELTRTALLDATVDCLVELGFSGTTTTEVTRRAGVSLGALQHHFPSKADLLVAAVDHILRRRQAEFRVAMASIDHDSDRVGAAIDLLWSGFSGPTFTAWLELWVAARTDPELAAAVVAVDREFVRASEEMFLELFPVADYPDVSSVPLPFAFALMDGVALQRLLPYRDDTEASIEKLKDLARLTLVPHVDRQER